MKILGFNIYARKKIIKQKSYYCYECAATKIHNEEKYNKLGTCELLEKACTGEIKETCDFYYSLDYQLLKERRF